MGLAEMTWVAEHPSFTPNCVTSIHWSAPVHRKQRRWPQHWRGLRPGRHCRSARHWGADGRRLLGWRRGGCGLRHLPTGCPEIVEGLVLSRGVSADAVMSEGVHLCPRLLTPLACYPISRAGWIIPHCCRRRQKAKTRNSKEGASWLPLCYTQRDTGDMAFCQDLLQALQGNVHGNPLGQEVVRSDVAANADVGLLFDVLEGDENALGVIEAAEAGVLGGGD